MRALRFYVTLLAALSLAAPSLTACGGRMIDAGDAGGRPDAGMGLDGGPLPGIDSGPPPSFDAGPRADAGPPDAGPPPCECPAFPTGCVPPAADTPVFTPDADDMLAQLFGVIACAEDTLDIAIYQGDWDCVVGAVNTQLARDADLTVRIIVDDEDCELGSCIAEELVPSERVTVVRDNRASNLMHHKIVVADASRAWIGSANFSQRSFCSDHNNALVVEQAEIVARLMTEFDRMAGGDFSSLSMEDGMPTTAGVYTLYFSPVTPQSEEAVWFSAMRAAIASATTSIDVMTNAWTRAEIANDMLNARGRDPSITIRALVSNSYADDLPAQLLAMEGADIRRGAFHDKAMIIDAGTDGAIVITGSANWSMNAWSNNENQLWIRDPAIAAAYTAEFEAAYAVAEPVTVAP